MYVCMCIFVRKEFKKSVAREERVGDGVECAGSGVRSVEKQAM